MPFFSFAWSRNFLSWEKIPVTEEEKGARLDSRELMNKELMEQDLAWESNKVGELALRRAAREHMLMGMELLVVRGGERHSEGRGAMGRGRGTPRSRNTLC